MTVLTESRRWMYELSEADVLMVWVSKPSVVGFAVGSQDPGRGSKEQLMARGGIKEFALRRSYLMKGVVSIR